MSYPYGWAVKWLYVDAGLLNFVGLLVIFGFLDVINVFDIGKHWVSSLLICNTTD
jgi:hypothetical protein